jgi:mono/diheme cytochrome c family protein
MADPDKSAEPKHPDLEESTNVAEAHAQVLDASAAQAREKRIAESGLEPVSLMVILASAVVLLVGGAVLGAGGKLFDYNPQPAGYVRADFESDADTGPVTGPIMDALVKRGKNLFAKCSGCHGSTGEGNGPKITVKGTDYNLNMPPQGPLTATELAALLTYVRNDFGNATGDVVTVEQAAAALKAAEGRPPGQTTVEELNSNHDKMLEGASIDAATIVDFETLQPVEAAPAAE